MNYLSAENLSKSFGDLVLFEGLSFGLSRGEKAALVARNGKGKSTLLRILAGQESSDTGEFTFRKGLKVAFLEQVPSLEDRLSIDELISSSHTPVLEVIARYERILALHARDHSPEHEKLLQEVTNEMDQAHGWDYERRLIQLLDLFRITDTSQKVGSLSGGEKKRVALALILLDEPELLILDEPTNHLDIEMIEWLEDYLSRSQLSLLMVTHDRFFLDRVCNRIMELYQGRLYHYPGNYEYFLGKRAEAEQHRQVEADRANQLMKRELEWLRRMPKARTHKSKSRIGAIEGIRQRASLIQDSTDLNLQVRSPRLGGKILEVEGLRKSYGKMRIIRDFTYKFNKGERVGIVGRNGSGKTTLLNLLTRNEEADSGRIDQGETVVMGYYRQIVPKWPEDMRVIDAVKEFAEVVHMADGRSISASRFLEHFMFPPESQYKHIARLSGGELRRLHLLTVLIGNPNFLFLDEPTNDLDLFSLARLEEFLLDFQGCLVIVSHDRYFLNKLCDHLFVMEGDGKVKNHYGTYAAYRQQKDLQAAVMKGSGHESSDARSRDEYTHGIKPKTRLSYKEQRELESLEAEIEALEKEKSGLETELNSGSLDYEELTKRSARVAELMEVIEQKIVRWMELSSFTMGG